MRWSGAVRRSGARNGWVATAPASRLSVTSGARPGSLQATWAVRWASFEAVAATAATEVTAAAGARTPSTKVAWIARLRKATSCTIPQAKRALEQAGPEGYDGALRLLVAEAASALDPAKLGRFVTSYHPDLSCVAVLLLVRPADMPCNLEGAGKLAGREAKQGLIGVATHPSRTYGILATLHSETDFVAKSPLFQELVGELLRSALFYQHPIPQGARQQGDADLLAMPIVPAPEATTALPEALESLEAKIHACMGKLGENICLGAVESVGGEPVESGRGASTMPLVGAYVHAGGDALNPGLGRIGALVWLEVSWRKEGDLVERTSHSATMTELARLADRLAQHVVGFQPRYLDSAAAAGAATEAEVGEGSVLLDQPFLFGGGTVAEVVQAACAQHGAQLSDLRLVHFTRHSIAA